MAKSNAVEKETPAFDVNALLASAATPKAEKKGGSKIPVVAVSDEVKALVKKYQGIIADIDAKEAEKEITGKDITDVILPMYEQKAGLEYLSSLKVPSTDGTNVTMIWQNKYSKIGTEHESTIKEVVGDNYNRMFTKVTEITVKDQSAETLTKLINAIGAEKFKEVFEVVQTIVPTVAYNEEKYRTFTKEQRDRLATIVKQAKPSIRAK